MMGCRKLVAVTVTFFTLSLSYGASLAAAKNAPQDELLPQPPPAASKPEEKNGETPVADDAIKLFLDKIEIMGELEKPQAVFIIPGVDPTIDDIKIDRSFFNEIFRSVEKLEKTRQIKKEETKDLHYLPW